MGMEGRHIAAIDLGTSKTALTVAEINGDDMQILYYRRLPSKGIRYSYVLNSGQAADVVRTLVADAEKELDIKITRTIVGMPKYSVRQETGRGNLKRSPDKCISEDEVNDLKRMSLDSYPLTNPETEEIFGAVAQSFSSGDEIGLTENDIIGVSSDVLEGNFKIFIGKKRHLHNIDMIFKELGIDVVQKCFTPDSTAKAILTQGEMDNGVALVDFGAGVTSVTVYYRNIMRHYAAIPFGGNAVTSDIKGECLIPEEYAEYIKKVYGGCMPDRLQGIGEKTLHISSGSAAPDTQVPVKFLSEIITARMKEIIDAILYEIQQSGFADNLKSGIVITGGGAALINCGNYIKELSGYDVRTGCARHFFSASGYENIYDSDATVSAGMVLMAKNNRIPECVLAAGEETMPEIDIKIDGDHGADTISGTGEETAEDVEEEETVFTNPIPDKPKKERTKKQRKVIWERISEQVGKAGEKFGGLFKEMYEGMDNEEV